MENISSDYELIFGLGRFIAPIGAVVFFLFWCPTQDAFLLISWIFCVAFFLISLIITKKQEKEECKRRLEQENISKGIQKVEMVCECGAVYPAEAIFCDKCGKQLTKRIVDNYVWKCPECGKTFENGEKFCPEHGKELVKSPKE